MQRSVAESPPQSKRMAMSSVFISSVSFVEFSLFLNLRVLFCLNLITIYLFIFLEGTEERF